MLEERGGAKRRSDRGAKQGEPKHIWVGWEPSFGRRYKKAFLRSLLSDHPTEILGQLNMRGQPRSVGLDGGCSLFSCLTADGKGVKDSLLSCLPIISPAPPAGNQITFASARAFFSLLRHLRLPNHLFTLPLQLSRSTISSSESSPKSKSSDNMKIYNE